MDVNEEMTNPTKGGSHIGHSTPETGKYMVAPCFMRTNDIAQADSTTVNQYGTRTAPYQAGRVPSKPASRILLLTY